MIVAEFHAPGHGEPLCVFAHGDNVTTLMELDPRSLPAG